MEIVKTREDAITPSRGTPGSAGLDLYTTAERRLLPGDRAVFPTGIKVKLGVDQVGLISPRSGLALKYGIDVLAGVIDPDYTGEIDVLLINHGSDSVSINVGDRVAQLLVMPFSYEMLHQVDRLGETHRGERGFGSTD